MHTNEQFDLSVLPEQAQNELYDFYLFLKQRYQNKEKQDNKNDKVLMELLELTRQQAIDVDSDIDIRGLIDQAHNKKDSKKIEKLTSIKVRILGK